MDEGEGWEGGVGGGSGDGTEVNAVDVGGGGEVGGEVAGYDACAATYLEDCGGGGYRGVDDAAFYQGDEGIVLVEEAGVFSCTGEGVWRSDSLP